MKKSTTTIAILFAASMAAPAAISAGGYGAAGCGLGAIVFGSKPGMIQVLAATTNATFYSQTFGITTGTSECGGGVVKVQAEQKVYAYNNFGQLQKEIAQGRGERLQTLAYLMGCDAKAVDAFGAAAQKNYSAIFSDKSVDSDAMLERVRSAVQSDAAVASQCSAL
ncbi:DUF3015 domain-containing protein [Turneriella parva]|uniref:DUF3015 domain-containing protein n=1 Tax=Turneriella parva (strain ATCC BAA-1111 / DSM 21527 / NCTC 11395 / H) TaxID=869212 RepID=I4B9F9_TURPD|nr:DUF3015 domain-containing protein [Turneriella parva]AFM13916.1 hypothetical protein Turpa_3277 [Turneriella parva DSM 21527]